MGNLIELASADGAVIPAYLTLPAGKPKGAVVVIQEIFGINSHIRRVAEGYAANGYLALAPALFARVKAGVELGYTQDDIQVGFALKGQMEAMQSEALEDIQAAINYAAAAGRVGIVGYCWGGLLTWRAACELDGLDAAVPYYGGGMTEEADRQPACPVLCHFAENDSYIPLPSVQAFQAAQPGVQVQIYPGTHHGFNCEQRGSYNEAAAKLASERSLAFYAKYLG